MLLGNGDGTFLPATTYYAGGQSSSSIVVADFNKDGKMDIAVANACSAAHCIGDGSVGILLGNGDGTFKPAVSYFSGGFNTISIAEADLNGDGAPDLVVANCGASFSSTCGDGNVGVLVGNGDGTFQSVVVYDTAGYAVVSVAVGDVNRDGKPDVVCGMGGAGVLLGRGDGTLQPVVVYGAGYISASTVAVVDVNGDGDLDIVAAGGATPEGTAGVLLGNGDGTFQIPITYDTAGYRPESVAAADVNGDGKPDLVVANLCPDAMCSGATTSVAVLPGNGDGTFQPATVFSSGGLNSGAVTIGDLNHDGKLDLAATNSISTSGDGAGPTVAVLLNISPSATIASVSSSIDPSTFNQLLTLTASVVPAAGVGLPTGVITFMDGSSSLGTSALNGSGIATLSTSTLSIGTHSITAVYGGDANFGGSTSPVLSQVVQGAIGAVAPNAINFGNVTVGAASSGQIVTFTNTGNIPLTLTSIAVSVTNGSYTQSNTCPTSPSSLAAGASCTATLTWLPATASTMTGTLTFTDNASTATQVVTLSGTGVAPSVSVSPASLNFGNQTVGVKSAAMLVTITNTGGAAVTISGFSFTGANATDFGKTNTCGTSLAVGASCTVSLTFKPGAAGARSATLNITDSAGNSPQTVSLSGTGVTPSVSLTPSSLTFATQVVFTSSTGQVVTLKNTGLGSLTINSVAITSSFTQTKTCGTSLAAGASCTITVKFNPQVKNTITGTLTVTDSAAGSPHTVSLSGVGTYVQLTPTTLNFGNQPVGTTSLGKKVTVSNKGGEPVTITAVTVSGTNPGDFAETNTCPISPATLASGASCFITTTFTPGAKGKRTGSLSVFDDGGGSPQTVSLTGSGT